MIQDRPITGRTTVKPAAAPVLVESIKLSRDRMRIAGITYVGTTRLLEQPTSVARTDRTEDRTSRGQVFVGLSGNDEVLESLRNSGTGKEEGARTTHGSHRVFMRLVPRQSDLSLHPGGLDAPLEPGIDVTDESKADIAIEVA